MSRSGALITWVAALLLTVGVMPAGRAVADEQGHGRAGELIAFAAVVQGRSQLFTVRPDGTGLTRVVTSRPDLDLLKPEWSPDGRTIVFEWANDVEGQLGRVDVDGRNLRLRPVTDSFASEPTYTPDGRWLLFEKFQLDPEVDAIFQTTPDWHGERQVTFPPTGSYDTDPSVSPDGRSLSFVRIRSGDDKQSALVTLDLRTGREHQVTPFSANVAVKQDWAPDGKRLTFTRDGHEAVPGISSNVMTIAPSGRHQRAVTQYAGGERRAIVGSYSPDGRWIVYREESPDGARLMKIRTDGSRATEVLAVPGLVPAFIDWGPGVRRR
ncbi:MAG TPA: hypothetical protein VIT41_10000 [Microlunatus sp.]